MKSLERSKTAAGRITIATNNFVGFRAPSKKLEGYNRFMNESQIELLHYESGAKRNIDAGLAFIFRETYQTSFREVLLDYKKCDPGTLESTLEVSQRIIDALRMRKIQKAIQENRWDIVLLLNGKGMPLALNLLIEAFIHEQKGETNVTILATSQAKSGMGMLFTTGNRRIAIPTTEFMLHDPTDESSLDARPVDITQFPTLQQFFKGKIESVLLMTNGEKRENLALNFRHMQTDSNNPDRKVRWNADESPGHVSEYLDEQSSLARQIESIIGRPLALGNYKNDPVARFALESETERMLRLEGIHGTYVHSVSNEWNVDMPEDDKRGDARAKNILCDIMRSEGLSARIKEPQS